MSSEAQQKWDLMHTFGYSYICQPPQKFWDDEEFLFQRDILLQQVHHDVHRTDWKTIYTGTLSFAPSRRHTRMLRRITKHLKMDRQRPSMKVFGRMLSEWMKKEK